ncbi:peptidoglycan DD-metalloendopeptidase family protein [Fodinicurvata sp. EGI_FJ10296]|uniref:peptidoglycan DD-metalloendopeptidase family protein n=1 Tax=Fodinicurvata sp. EGI_FJ10296 TaxID=3231908 RepID=UPI003451C531
MILPFRDRQILVRSEQGVRHLHLRARHQVLAVSACAALLILALAGTVGTVVGVTKVGNREARLSEMRVEYAQVIARAAESRTAFAAGAAGSGIDTDVALADAEADAGTGAGGLSQPNSVADRVLTDNAHLRDALQAVRSEKRHLEAQLAGLDERLDERAAEVVQLETRLSEALRAESEASHRVAVLDRDLNSVRAEMHNLNSLSADRASEIGRLETALARAEDWNQSLESEVRDLSQSVNRAITTARATADDRNRLSSEIDGALQSVANADREREDARQLMHAALSGAETLRRNRNALLTALGTEQARADRLTGMIDDLVASQQYVFAELRDRTDRQREELAEGLGHTGLDIDSMIDDVWSEMYPGVGGPFLPVSGISFLDATVWSAANELTESVERATATHELVARLPVAMPVRDDYRLSSRFGQRRDPFTGRASGHLGLDFAAPRGTPVTAPAHGTVTSAGWRGAYGRLVEVDHGFGITTRYAHLTHISVQEGQELTTGEEIGKIGTTGRSTGPHLHYEIRSSQTAMNPENYLEAGNHVFAVTNQE